MNLHYSIKSFVLRSGRISAAQKKSYESGGNFIIPYSKNKADFSQYFGNNNPLTVEIGFGMGKATAEIAEANPGNNYVGIEVFKAGIGKLLWEIKERSLTNIRIIEHDAVEVIENMVNPSSIAAFHIFFPDPWPKKRHHKRRLIKKPFAESLVSKLIPGGYIYMVSDFENYAEDTLTIFSALPELVNPYGNTFAEGISWRPPTKFEKKGIEKNHPIKEIYFLKKR